MARVWGRLTSKRIDLPATIPLTHNAASFEKTAWVIDDSCVKDREKARMRVIREIHSKKRDRKVCIFQREDGSYGFEEWSFSDDPFENTWLPITRGATFAPDLEIALREAYGRVSWLAGNAPDG